MSFSSNIFSHSIAYTLYERSSWTRVEQSGVCVVPLFDVQGSASSLSFQWNGHRQKERTLGVELLGRNIAPLYFKTERIAKTALRALWFLATLAQFAGTC